MQWLLVLLQVLLLLREHKVLHALCRAPPRRRRRPLRRLPHLLCLLGLMRHHAPGRVIARKAPPHPRPGVCQRLAALVLDTALEVALLPLQPVALDLERTLGWGQLAHLAAATGFGVLGLAHASPSPSPAVVMCARGGGVGPGIRTVHQKFTT